MYVYRLVIVVNSGVVVSERVYGVCIWTGYNCELKGGYIRESLRCMYIGSDSLTTYVYISISAISTYVSFV